jgi:hypothetical protein
LKTVTLDWKGWWLLKQPMTKAPEMALKASVYAVVGAKLEKTGAGIACSQREIIVVGAHRGETLEEFLANLQKSAMGHFIRTRASEIKKHPIVYVARFDENADFAEQAGVVSLLYDNLPFAPKHFAMPAKYAGNALKLVNCGRTFGLKPEYVVGGNDDGEGEKRRLDSNSTHNPDADEAMAGAIAQEVQATRKVSRSEMDVRGIATEKVEKPAGMIETERVTKPLPGTIETERVTKPLPGTIETERVTKPLSGVIATERVDKPAELSDRLRKVAGDTASGETGVIDTTTATKSDETEIDMPRR